MSNLFMKHNIFIHTPQKKVYMHEMQLKRKNPIKTPILNQAWLDSVWWELGKDGGY